MGIREILVSESSTIDSIPYIHNALRPSLVYMR